MVGMRRQSYADYTAAQIWKDTQHEHDGVFFLE